MWTRPNLSDEDHDQTFCITTAVKHDSLKPQQSNKRRTSCNTLIQSLFSFKDSDYEIRVITVSVVNVFSMVMASNTGKVFVKMLVAV